MRRPGPHGFSLLEALAAIAIVGTGLLVASSALEGHAAMARRTALRLQMLEVAEEVLESVRGQALPLASGAVAWPAEGTNDDTSRVHSSLRVVPREVEGLYEVTAVVRAQFLGEPVKWELTTMVWRP